MTNCFIHFILFNFKKNAIILRRSQLKIEGKVKWHSKFIKSNLKSIINWRQIVKRKIIYLVDFRWNKFKI